MQGIKKPTPTEKRLAKYFIYIHRKQSAEKDKEHREQITEKDKLISQKDKEHREQIAEKDKVISQKDKQIGILETEKVSQYLDASSETRKTRNWEDKA